jgi:hypothetical protein
MNPKFIDPDQLENDYYKKTKESVIIKLDATKRQELEHLYANLSSNMKEKIDFLDSVKDLMNVDIEDVDLLRQSIVDLVEEADFCGDGLKVLKKQTAEILTNLKKGYMEEERVVYYMDDRITGKMVLYLDNGEFYEERVFEPEEMQTKIKNIG